MGVFRASFLAFVASLAVGMQSAAAQDGLLTHALVQHDDAWYTSDPAARIIATALENQQSPEGGWPKNTPLSASPSEIDPGARNTIDNNATTLPLAFLARYVSATSDPKARRAFDHGLDYLLDAQYPNGGWPQYWPLRGGYHDHITFNDDAMVNVLNLLRDIGSGESPYAFVDPERKSRVAEAVERGVDVILAAQIRRNGVPTGWCAQHDASTLEPAWARRFEPPSISGAESVGVLRFLMSLPDPRPDVIAAVEGAAAWLESAAMKDTALVAAQDEQGRQDRQLVGRSGARVWARFYDIETGRPIYAGRDSVIHDSLSSIEYERRNGYHYVGVWAERLLTRDYTRWKSRLSDAPRAPS